MSIIDWLARRIGQRLSLVADDFDERLERLEGVCSRLIAQSKQSRLSNLRSRERDEELAAQAQSVIESQATSSPTDAVPAYVRVKRKARGA